MNTANTAGKTNRIIALRLITHLRQAGNDTPNYQCTVDKCHRTAHPELGPVPDYSVTIRQLKGSIYSTGGCRRCKLGVRRRTARLGKGSWVQIPPPRPNTFNDPDTICTAAMPAFAFAHRSERQPRSKFYVGSRTSFEFRAVGRRYGDCRHGIVINGLFMKADGFGRTT
jgi:hypothetical protein